MKPAGRTVEETQPRGRSGSAERRPDPRRSAVAAVLLALLAVVFTALGLPAPATASPAAATIESGCIEPSLRAYFNDHWVGVRRDLQRWATRVAVYPEEAAARAALSPTVVPDDELAFHAKMSEHLYLLAAQSEAFLEAAIVCEEVDLFEDLLASYLEASRGMRQQTHVFAKNLPHSSLVKFARRPLSKPARMWVVFNKDKRADDPDYHVRVPVEPHLASAKMMYLAARAISFIAQRSPAERTPLMMEFVDEYWNTAIEGHLERWILTHPHGFAPIKFCHGEEVRYSLADYVENLADRAFPTTPSYCNALRDSDLIVVTGLTEALTAHAHARTLAPITAERRAEFAQFLRRSVDLIRSRLSATRLETHAGRRARGVLIDLGTMDDHSDFACAGFEGDDPRWGACVPAANVGWDLNHSKSLLTLARSLYDNRRALRSVGARMRWPKRRFFRHLGNQVAYAVFNGSMEKPRFANFMDGSNGWYRSTDNGGYCPSCRSDAYFNGGWSRLANSNADLKRLNHRLIEILHTAYVDRGSATAGTYDEVKANLRRFYGVKGFPNGFPVALLAHCRPPGPDRDSARSCPQDLRHRQCPRTVPGGRTGRSAQPSGKRPFGAPGDRALCALSRRCVGHRPAAPRAGVRNISRK